MMSRKGHRSSPCECLSKVASLHMDVGRNIGASGDAGSCVGTDGPEPRPAPRAAYLDAGYDHVYLHQVGPDQKGFIEFAADELLPVIAADASGRPRKAS